jgi:hypothetical protein
MADIGRLASSANCGWSRSIKHGQKADAKPLVFLPESTKPVLNQAIWMLGRNKFQSCRLNRVDAIAVIRAQLNQVI